MYLLFDYAGGKYFRTMEGNVVCPRFCLSVIKGSEGIIRFMDEDNWNNDLKAPCIESASALGPWVLVDLTRNKRVLR